MDESIKTWWTARGSKGEWLKLDLGEPCSVHGIQINFAEEGIPVMQMPPEACGLPGAVGGRYVDSGKQLRTRYLLEGSLDGENWTTLVDARTTEETAAIPTMCWLRTRSCDLCASPVRRRPTTAP